MTDLSPAAQAVLDAVLLESNLSPTVRVAAAALRAAADQVTPEEPLYGGDDRWTLERDTRQACRKKLLAIADELDGKND